MTGIVATLVNQIIKHRLPSGSKETETVHKSLQAEREILKNATNRLLEELVNSAAMEMNKNDDSIDK